MTAEMRQEPPRHRKLAAGHGDGAMMEVDAERKFHRVIQHAERLHVIGKRNVTKSGALLGGGDRLVDRDRSIIGEKAHEPEDLPPYLARLMPGQNEVGNDDRAGVDERIARYSALVFELDDGVERAAGGLAADALPQPVANLA